MTSNFRTRRKTRDDVDYEAEGGLDGEDGGHPAPLEPAMLLCVLVYPHFPQTISHFRQPFYPSSDVT